MAGRTRLAGRRTNQNLPTRATSADGMMLAASTPSLQAVRPRATSTRRASRSTLRAVSVKVRLRSRLLQTRRGAAPSHAGPVAHMLAPDSASWRRAAAQREHGHRLSQKGECAPSTPVQTPVGAGCTPPARLRHRGTPTRAGGRPRGGGAVRRAGPVLNARVALLSLAALSAPPGPAAHTRLAPSVAHPPPPRAG